MGRMSGKTNGFDEIDGNCDVNVKRMKREKREEMRWQRKEADSGAMKQRRKEETSIAR